METINKNYLLNFTNGKRLCGLFIFLFLTLQLCAQNQKETPPFNPYKVSLDSAVNWLQNARLEKDPDFSIIAQDISKLAKQKNRYYDLGRIHTYISNWHYLNNTLYDSDSIILNQEKSIAYYFKADSLDAAHEMYLGVAVDYMNNDELKKAEETILKATQYFEKTNNDPWLAEAHVHIASLYLLTEKPEKVIEYVDKSFNILLKHEEYLMACSLLFNSGDANIMLGNFEKALIDIDKCIELSSTHDFIQNKDVLVAAFEKKGNIYNEQKEYDQALIYFTKAWEQNNTLGGKENADFFRSNIGKTLMLQGHYEAALPHLIAGIKGKQHSEIERDPELYLALSRCYEQLGNYSKALENRDIAMTLKIDDFEDQIDMIQSEMIVKYETEKKEEALAAQEKLITQKNKTQQLIIGVAALLFILSFFLFYFFKKNKKTTRIISRKNSENELLLKEIHHRVKNNLEMVKSLIALQSAHLEDSATKDAMNASQNRVQSMGIIHQKLYQGTNLGSIEMKDYFMNLGEGILDSFNAENQVKIICAMDHLELDVDTAVPIGLIVNELLTNSLKYAFPKGEKGKIEINLVKSSNDTLTLKVADNGIGKIQNLPAQGTGFGSQLVQLLTQQLNGNLHEEAHNGTITFFQFKLDTAA